MASTEIDQACKKKSFLKFPLEIDTQRLLEEYQSIPEHLWGGSHWDVHCSIDMLLLRGGSTGTDEDFTTTDVSNAPILEKMPYISSLLAEEGPFGGAIYAFIFRTKPNGITRVHIDDHASWVKTVRIHVPIISNKGAFLLSEQKAKHFEVGAAWTFNNQVLHSVVNGDETRVHMIFDVNPNSKLADMMTRATFEPGELDLDRWELTWDKQSSRDVKDRPMLAVLGEPISQDEKNNLNINAKGFATRITEIGLKGKLLLTPLKLGDIVTAVNDIDQSTYSRTALDYLVSNHEVGERVSLDIIRAGKKITKKIKLKPESYFSVSLRLERLMEIMRLKQPAAN